LDELKRLTDVITTVPENFKLHPLLQKVIADRRLMMQEEIRVDWGLAEHLAFATLLTGGYSVSGTVVMTSVRRFNSSKGTEVLTSSVQLPL